MERIHADNPLSMKTVYGVWCRRCGSYVRCELTARQLIDAHQTHDSVLRRLEENFRKDFPKDCDEAWRENTVRSVLES